MAIPCLDERGLLPPGVFCATLSDICQGFSYNKRRVELYQKLESFICEELMQCASGLSLLIGGSYLSDKPNPGDIEAALRLNLDNFREYDEKLKHIIHDFNFFHAYVKQQYEVDFYPSFDGGPTDYSLFFGYVGTKTGQSKGLHPKDKRGIVEIRI